MNADELARVAVAPGSLGLAQIVEHFGPTVLTSDGQLDRAKLGERVFSDNTARQALDAIVHPRVRELAVQHFQALGEQGEPLACYEVPLLYEVGLEQTYHPVLVVTAPLALRKSRLAQRDGFDERQIEARIAAQMPLDEKARRADYVIDNAGSLHELNERSDAVLDAVCRKFGVPVERYLLPPSPIS